MSNSDLADKLAADHGTTKADARKLVDPVFAAIVDSAANGEEISLNGFGKFKVKDKAVGRGVRGTENSTSSCPIDLGVKCRVRSQFNTGQIEEPSQFSRIACAGIEVAENFE